MARIWVIAPYDSGETELFDTAWEFDKQNNTIALGWSELGDISKISRLQLEALFTKTYGKEKTKAVTTKDINALWAFYHEIHEGDIIVSRRGRKKILSTGSVIGSAYYDEKKGRARIANKSAYSYPNFISVAWDGKAIDYERQVFSFYTIYEISEERLLELKNESNILKKNKEYIGEKEESEIEVYETQFVLEKYLEDFIVSNFDSIFSNQYVLYKDPDGNPAQQYPIISKEGKIFGRIDILAVEKHTKDYIVIELKKGKESDPVVGQMLRYIGWVKENMCEENQSVKGIIICNSMDEKLLYAVEPLKELIKVKMYKVDFKLNDLQISGSLTTAST